ncbi:MAG TPA: DUF6421 family protein [Ktedonobacterales bacterium]|jgi:hypothetical protein
MPVAQEKLSQVIALVDQFQPFQLPDGSVDSAHLDKAKDTLHQLLALLEPHASEYPNLKHGVADMRDWLKAGLDTEPQIAHLAANYEDVPEGHQDIIFTVTSTVNYSPNHRLEIVLYERKEGEPARELRRIYDCPLLQIVKMINGSSGFGPNSNCIVEFTECLSGPKGRPDTFAIFFTSKNALRGKRITQPLMEQVIAPKSFTRLRRATLEELELVVPCKTVFHEWYHRQGVMPLQYFHTLLDTVAGGAFEEARVETGAALKLFELAQTSHPYAEIYEMAAMFIIADRTLRYPYAHHPNENCDALSGQYILAQLIQKGCVHFDAAQLHFETPARFVEALTQVQKELLDVANVALLSSHDDAIQAIHDHIFKYTPTKGKDGYIHRSVFHEWLERRANPTIGRLLAETTAREEEDIKASVVGD